MNFLPSAEPRATTIATPAGSSASVDHDLQSVAAEVEFLPELLRTWDDEPPGHRLAWEVEWWDMMGRYRRLHEACVAGVMTPGQRDRLLLLAREITSSATVLTGLGFPLPSNEALT